MAVVKPRVWLRADASTEIGYGHFVRSLALGEMLGGGFELVFATRSPTLLQIEQIKAVCSGYVALGENHFEAFLALLEPADVVVLDNYFFDTDYQQKIKGKGCKLVCVDDMHDKHYVADVVINHGLNDPALFSIEPYTRLCLGLDWALLRGAFFDRPQPTKRRDHTVAVCFGGVDAPNLTGRVCEALSLRSDLDQIMAVVGPAYAHQETLKRSNKVNLLSNLSAQQMADLFRSVSLAIVPTSTVCLEALACGCRVVSGYYVANQKEGAEALVDQGAIVSVGDWLAGSIAEKLEAAWGQVSIPIRSLHNTPENYRILFAQ